MVRYVSMANYRLDPLLDCLPLISTVSNTVHLIEKLVLKALLKTGKIASEDIVKSHYFHGVRHKSALRCLVLLFPFGGNIAVFIYTLCYWRKYSDRREFVWDMSCVANGWKHNMLTISESYRYGWGVEKNEALAGHWKKQFDKAMKERQEEHLKKQAERCKTRVRVPSVVIERNPEEMHAMNIAFYRREVSKWLISDEIKNEIIDILSGDLKTVDVNDDLKVILHQEET